MMVSLYNMITFFTRSGAASSSRPRPVTRTLSLNTNKSTPAKDDSSSSGVKTRELRRSASMKKPDSKTTTSAVAPRASKTVTKSGSKSNVKETTPATPAAPSQDNSVTFRSRQKRPPAPPVPPKPRPGKLDLKDLAAGANKAVNNKNVNNKHDNTATTTESVKPVKTSSPESVKPVKTVMKKMVSKTSVAELAKFAETPADNVDPRHTNQFVSHARATLSPAPARKQR